MKQIPDSSVDLILIDPPYNIGKAKWDKINNYVEWLGSVFKECERVLNPTGSFYFFHNDFLQIVDLQNYINKNTNFIFRQFIVWNKRFKEAKNKGFLDGFIEVEHLRNYQQMAEYCLFYTFQDGTGLDKIKKDINNFITLREYFKKYQEALGLNKKQIIDKIGQQADHCFRWKSSQWDLPTKETYTKINQLELKDKTFLRREYEDLRREYEDLRYTFNNQKTSHSVMNYNIAKKQGHITPKPIDLLQNLILHSSNENDIILDCFMGSGSTGVACINTNRNFIGIELDKNYFNIAENRINEVFNNTYK